MSEETKKVEETKEEVKPTELSEQELNKVSGAGYTPPKAGQIPMPFKDWGK